MEMCIKWPSIDSMFVFVFMIADVKDTKGNSYGAFCVVLCCVES